MGELVKLKDGAEVAVIGGGPAGSFFSIFALVMSEMVGNRIKVSIFEPKDFNKSGPKGCNRCGGIISELLLQTLAVEGINLPDSVIQKGINSYQLNTNSGNLKIESPALEKTIAAVYRGVAPKGVFDSEKKSFDQFLLSLAEKRGAVHVPKKIERIEYACDKPRLFAEGEKVMEADLVVGAFGVNSSSSEVVEALGFGYRAPRTMRTAIAEVFMEREVVAKHFGNSIYLFLLPESEIKFAAIIPKGTHLTVCILGKNLNSDSVPRFLSHPTVKNAWPQADYEICCQCLPKMNVGAPKKPFTDRIVMCGDAGSSRLFKDGIGAAHMLAKAAANTAVFHGVGAGDFKRHYLPIYRSLVRDNLFGRYLFAATSLLKKSALCTRSMLEVVRDEQNSENDPKTLSAILWDMFTGSERYKNIFYRGLSFRLFRKLIGKTIRLLFKSKQEQA